MLFLCFSSRFTPMHHALCTSLISVQYTAMFPSLLFHSATAMQLHHALLPFHFMAMLDACP